MTSFRNAVSIVLVAVGITFVALGLVAGAPATAFAQDEQDPCVGCIENCLMGILCGGTCDACPCGCPPAPIFMDCPCV